MSKKTTTVFKAFCREDGGSLKFFMKAHNGTRLVPTNQWLIAKKRWVRSGSNSKHYRSGFHVFKTRAELVQWSKRVKRSFIVREVEVRDLRKERAHNVATELFVPSK